MIRVLHVIGSLNFGGSQKLVTSLYENINRDDISFDFVVDRPEEMQLKKELESLGASIFVLPQFRGYNFIPYIFKWNKFLRRHKYDIVHGHVRSTAAIYLFIAKLHGTITISHSHSTSSGKGLKAAIKGFLQFFIRFISDYYLACSYEAGKWLFGKKAVSTNRFYVVNNGIDFSKYKYNGMTRDYLRKELGLTDSFVIGHVGRFHESKNHYYLLQIFKNVLDFREDCKLLLVGDFDDSEYKKAVEFVNSNGLMEKVVFYGPSNEIPQLLNVMDCFVFPSKWEGFGISVLEAQANGLPCFISNTIPDNVIICDKVKQLSISTDPVNWALEIVKNDLVDRSLCAYDPTFDIKETSKWLESFYSRIVNGR